MGQFSCATHNLSSNTCGVCTASFMCVYAFFSSQGAQAVGMGKEALNVRAAAELFDKANDILGYPQTSDAIYLFAPPSKLAL